MAKNPPSKSKQPHKSPHQQLHQHKSNELPSCYGIITTINDTYGFIRQLNSENDIHFSRNICKISGAGFMPSSVSAIPNPKKDDIVYVTYEIQHKENVSTKRSASAVSLRYKRLWTGTVVAGPPTESPTVDKYNGTGIDPVSHRFSIVADDFRATDEQRFWCPVRDVNEIELREGCQIEFLPLENLAVHVSTRASGEILEIREGKKGLNCDIKWGDESVFYFIGENKAEKKAYRVGTRIIFQPYVFPGKPKTANSGPSNPLASQPSIQGRNAKIPLMGTVEGQSKIKYSRPDFGAIVEEITPLESQWSYRRDVKDQRVFFYLCSVFVPSTNSHEITVHRAYPILRGKIVSKNKIQDSQSNLNFSFNPSCILGSIVPFPSQTFEFCPERFDEISSQSIYSKECVGYTNAIGLSGNVVIKLTSITSNDPSAFRARVISTLDQKFEISFPKNVQTTFPSGTCMRIHIRPNWAVREYVVEKFEKITNQKFTDAKSQSQKSTQNKSEQQLQQPLAHQLQPKAKKEKMIDLSGFGNGNINNSININQLNVDSMDYPLDMSNHLGNSLNDSLNDSLTSSIGSTSTSGHFRHQSYLNSNDAFMLNGVGNMRLDEQDVMYGNGLHGQGYGPFRNSNEYNSLFGTFDTKPSDTISNPSWMSPPNSIPHTPEMNNIGYNSNDWMSSYYDRSGFPRVSSYPKLELSSVNGNGINGNGNGLDILSPLHAMDYNSKGSYLLVEDQEINRKMGNNFILLKRLTKKFHNNLSQAIAINKNPLLARYYSLEEEGSSYLLIERYQLSLPKAIRDSNIDLKSELQLKNIAHSVTRAIEYLHRNNVIHGNVNPQNIFLTRDRRTVLSNYALSSEINNTITKHLQNDDGFNSDTYQPIEIVTNYTPNPTVESDVFSLGCTIGYLYLHTHPFDQGGDGEGEEKLYQLHENMQNDNPVGLDKLAEDKEIVKDLISWMVKSTPKLRPSIEQVLNHPYFWSDCETVNFFNNISTLLQKKSSSSKAIPTVFDEAFKLQLLNLGSIFETKRGWIVQLKSHLAKPSIVDDLVKKCSSFHMQPIHGDVISYILFIKYCIATSETWTSSLKALFRSSLLSSTDKSDGDALEMPAASSGEIGVMIARRMFGLVLVVLWRELAVAKDRIKMLWAAYGMFD